MLSGLKTYCTQVDMFMAILLHTRAYQIRGKLASHQKHYIMILGLHNGKLYCQWALDEYTHLLRIQVTSHVFIELATIILYFHQFYITTIYDIHLVYCLSIHDMAYSLTTKVHMLIQDVDRFTPWRSRGSIMVLSVCLYQHHHRYFAKLNRTQRLNNQINQLWSKWYYCQQMFA